MYCIFMNLMYSHFLVCIVQYASVYFLFFFYITFVYYFMDFHWWYLTTCFSMWPLSPRKEEEIYCFRIVLRPKCKGKSSSSGTSFGFKCLRGQLPSIWEFFFNFLLSLWDRKWSEVKFAQWSRNSKSKLSGVLTLTYAIKNKKMSINTLQFWLHTDCQKCTWLVYFQKKAAPMSQFG